MLTRREQEIFNLLVGGALPKDIASALNISYDTVASHQKRLYRKLGVHSVNELLAKYPPANGSTLPSASSFPIQKNKATLIKILAIASAAVVVVFITVFLLAGTRHSSNSSQLTVPNPLVITFIDNKPHGWIYVIEPDFFAYENETRASPFRLGTTNRITEGEVYSITFSFTSNADINMLAGCFVDKSVSADGYWTPLSTHKVLVHNVKAGVEYNGSSAIRIIKTASSTSERANYFELDTMRQDGPQPTLTFTRLEIHKVNN